MMIIVFIIVAAAASIFIYSTYIEPRRFRRVEARIRIMKGLKKPVRILHISDLHFRKGDEPKMAFLEGLQEIPVDMVFVTGDMIEDDTGIDYCVEALSGFEPSIGVFAVFGAHDRWFSPPLNVVLDLSIGGYHEGVPNDFGHLKRELEVAGVVCLENESRRIPLPGSPAEDDDVWIVGIDDMFVGRDRLDEALADVTPNALKILLTHTVESPEELASRGFDAVFAGHSHGGQVRLPFFGPIMTRSSLPRKFASGVFEVAGTQFHLNNGIGAGRWTPFRFLCPPEATFIELTGRQRT